jgi:hypothetical protein
VTRFKASETTPAEDQCTATCLAKFLKMGERLSVRFQEHQMLNAEAAGAPIGLTAVDGKR